jgi:Protein of unknown function (DUF3261)
MLSRPITLRFLLVLVTIFSASCATRHEASPGSTRIAPGLEFSIPTGRELGYSIEVTQLITAHYGDRVQVFQAYVGVSPEKITLIALDPFGNRALTVTATDDGIHTEAAPIVPTMLHAENILADLTIVYWPGSAIQRRLVGTSASLYDDQSERKINVDGREVVTVRYESPHEHTWAKRAHLHNIAYGYELDLQSTVTGK